MYVLLYSYLSSHCHIEETPSIYAFAREQHAAHLVLQSKHISVCTEARQVPSGSCLQNLGKVGEEEVKRTHVFAQVDDEQDISVEKSQKKHNTCCDEGLHHCKIAAVDVRQFG